MDIGVVINIIIWGGGVAIALLSWFIWDKRYHNVEKDAIPPGYQRTEEVFIDPVEGRRVRVYYNPQTGERFYKNEQ